jgi:hypothetical protein
MLLNISFLENARYNPAFKKVKKHLQKLIFKYSSAEFNMYQYPETSIEVLRTYEEILTTAIIKLERQNCLLRLKQNKCLKELKRLGIIDGRVYHILDEIRDNGNIEKHSTSTPHYNIYDQLKNAQFIASWFVEKYTNKMIIPIFIPQTPNKSHFHLVG